MYKIGDYFEVSLKNKNKLDVNTLNKNIVGFTTSTTIIVLTPKFTVNSVEGVAKFLHLRSILNSLRMDITPLNTDSFISNISLGYIKVPKEVISRYQTRIYPTIKDFSVIDSMFVMDFINEKMFGVFKDVKFKYTKWYLFENTEDMFALYTLISNLYSMENIMDFWERVS